jgi:hypothetical protein
MNDDLIFWFIKKILHAQAGLARWRRGAGRVCERRLRASLVELLFFQTEKMSSFSRKTKSERFFRVAQNSTQHPYLKPKNVDFKIADKVIIANKQ